MYQKNMILAGLLIASCVTNTALSQEIKRQDTSLSAREIRALIERGLPETLSEDNTALAASLLSAKIGEPVQAALEPERLAAKLFEGRQATMSDGCLESTRAKADCLIMAGEASGPGEFLRLAVRFDEQELNVKFDKRDPDTAPLPSAKLSDADAYKQALEILRGSLAVNPVEIPQAPSDAKNPFPVRSINVAAAVDAKPTRVATVEKLVKIQRGLYAGDKLGWVPGPGQFIMRIDDRGINGLSLRDWANLERYGRGLNPSGAKSRSELVTELTERLQREGISQVTSVNSVIAVAKLDSADSPVPVLRAFVTAQPADLPEEAQARVLSSAGVVLEVPLIAPKDDDQEGDD